MVDKIKRPQINRPPGPEDNDQAPLEPKGHPKITPQPNPPSSQIESRRVTIISGMTSSVSNYLQYLLGVNVESKFSELLNKNPIFKQAYLLDQFTHDDFKLYFMGDGNGSSSRFQQNFYTLVENSPLFADALVRGIFHPKHFSKLPKETMDWLLSDAKMQDRLIKIIHLRNADTDDIIRDVLGDVRATKLILDNPSILKNLANLDKDVRKTLFSSVPLLIFYLTHEDHKLSPENFENIGQHISLLERLKDSPELLSLGTKLPFKEMIQLLENPFALFLIQNEAFLARLIKDQSVEKILNQLSLRDAESMFDINLLPILLDVIPTLRSRVIKQHLTMDDLMEIPISLAINLMSHQTQQQAHKAAINLNRILMDPKLFKQLLRSPQLLEKSLDDRDFAMAIKSLHKNNQLGTLLNNPDIQTLILIKPDLITRRQFADVKSLADFAVLIKVSPSLANYFKKHPHEKAFYMKLSIDHKQRAQEQPEMILYLALKEEVTMKSYHSLIPEENLKDIPLGQLIEIEGLTLDHNPLTGLTLSLDEASYLPLRSLDLLFDHMDTSLKMLKESREDFLLIAQSPERLEALLKAPSIEDGQNG